ncbi:MAG: enoyl-CoA hydratase/isomerase family protein [SAR202 cluster bacterium]|jgi:enoyl-CoA hydratase/carnithine racemase|nr:enoyl-CoA hydratase/isomerase family protein [Dehalococcoidia bacterium]MQG07610.1 enoyl-CoA hydratase/isomerase family protein [SAR202 cluster bacterium]MQG25833.1 enoyl-CoA hydratase/isomerase family protein [SAR202 cluster bacterium]MQG52120.1 enoyl-CoA hydratase/isomerase family protein [SAR202 cluster bacterium]CAI8274824.1 MAG: Short-chain-enoyl-CoA hydratase [Chloroflexota bacterium]|tara:strand:+ start:424 stop:1194 length:771 start_codon:yes stop_codon:yes gene_type:complete
MAYEHILTRIESGVGIITLDRPEVLNAMNRKLSSELHDAVSTLNQDDEVGCLVVTGSGQKAFTAGGDIHEQRENDQLYTQEQLDEWSSERQQASYEISASPKPIIGMINGLAYGGGAVLSSSLDFRIGCENSSFRFLAAAYGRINCSWTLPNQVGWPMAKELLFTGRVVAAEEAYRIGLLNHLVPSNELLDKTMEIATTISKNHRGSVVGIKELMLQGLGENLKTQWENETYFTSNVMRGAKAEEAFPEFIARKGR